jgi:hypothetical protein
MTTRQVLDHAIETLPDDRLGEVLCFVQSLQTHDSGEAWSQFGRTQLAKAYGDDEPEYTEADIKPEIKR